MDRLPLRRVDDSGHLQLSGYGTVNLEIDYRDVLGTGGHGVVFRGRIFNLDGSLVMEVALKVHKVVDDPHRQLRAEAEIHAQAWAQLRNVVRPLGFLPAHEITSTPALLVMEIGVPFAGLLAQAGPIGQRNLQQVKAITRVIHQLLRFIVEGDAINLMHKDIKMENMFVTKMHDLDQASLAVGDFGGAQIGEETDDGNVIYRTGVYTWNEISPRLASIVYGGMAGQGIPREDIELDQQLIFYNDLFGWARICFKALTDRPPPDILYGPSPEDYECVPPLGYGDVLDAVHHLLHFALQLLTAGRLDEIVDSEYIDNLEWFDDLSRVLSGNGSGSTA